MGQTLEHDRAGEALTDKQVEALDLLIKHHSNKEMARLLHISPSAVEKRLQGASIRLGAQGRQQLARKYATLDSHCGKATGAFPQLHSDAPHSHGPTWDTKADGHYVLSDVSSFAEFAPWDNRQQPTILEKYANRWGNSGLITLIVAQALGLAILVLVIFAISRALGEVL